MIKVFRIFIKISRTFNIKVDIAAATDQWQSVLVSHAGVQGSISGRDRPKSLKQVVTAQLPSARQQVLVSRDLEDDHYERMTRVTVDLAH